MIHNKSGPKTRTKMSACAHQTQRCESVHFLRPRRAGHNDYAGRRELDSDGERPMARLRRIVATLRRKCTTPASANLADRSGAPAATEKTLGSRFDIASRRRPRWLSCAGQRPRSSFGCIIMPRLGALVKNDVRWKALILVSPSLARACVCEESVLGEW